MRIKVARLKGPLKVLIMKDYPMVKWVRDATAPLSFKLTEKDIRGANPRSFTNCPNARCMKRCIPHTAAVVSKCTALVISGVEATRYIIRPGGNARKVIVSADTKSEGVVGMTFTLSKPTHGQRLGSPHVRTSTGAGPKHKNPFVRNVSIDQKGAVVSFAPALRGISA